MHDIQNTRNTTIADLEDILMHLRLLYLRRMTLHHRRDPSLLPPHLDVMPAKEGAKRD